MADHLDGDGDAPSVDQLEAMSPADAFEFLSGQVPELLQLRDRIAPTRTPVDPDLTFEESRERQRQRDGGGFLNANARESMKGRTALRSELARMVGPRAVRGNDLVRSEAALFLCLAYLFVVPWDSESESQGS